MGEAPPPIAELRPDAPAALERVGHALPGEGRRRRGRRTPPSDRRALERRHERQRHAGDAAGADRRTGGMLKRALVVYAASVVGVLAISLRPRPSRSGCRTGCFPGALDRHGARSAGDPVHRRTCSRGATRARCDAGAHAGRRTRRRTARWRRSRSRRVHTSRGSVRRAAVVYALGAFAALIVAFMVMRAFGIGPVGSLFAAGKAQSKRRACSSPISA